MNCKALSIMLSIMAMQVAFGNYAWSTNKASKRTTDGSKLLAQRRMQAFERKEAADKQRAHIDLKRAKRRQNTQDTLIAVRTKRSEDAQRSREKTTIARQQVSPKKAAKLESWQTRQAERVVERKQNQTMGASRRRGDHKKVMIEDYLEEHGAPDSSEK